MPNDVERAHELAMEEIWGWKDKVQAKYEGLSLAERQVRMRRDVEPLVKRLKLRIVGPTHPVSK
jgi:hypothetical protein